MDTEGAIESVPINEVSVFSRLNWEKIFGLSFPRDKANSTKQWAVRIKRVSQKKGLTVLCDNNISFHLRLYLS